MSMDDYRTEVMRRRAREIAYNLASDGGISDADIAECCDLTMEEVHDIVVEVTVNTRQQLQVIREKLRILEQPKCEVEQLKTAFIDIITILKKLIYFRDISTQERQSIENSISYYEEREFRDMLRPLQRNLPNYELLSTGASIVNRLYARMYASVLDV